MEPSNPDASSGQSGRLVSCVLPTRNRAAFIPHAIRSYQSQTYPFRELVIVDNGTDETASLIPDDPTIRYVRVTGPQTTGEMRNLCGQHAQGDIICHFDSDDWSAPERVADQVARLGVTGVVTGYHSMYFYDERDGRCYQWQTKSSPPTYVLGTSLCYLRQWWNTHRFWPISVGEDVRFFKHVCRVARRNAYTAPAGPLMVARVHDHQTCRKTLTRTSYVPVPRQALPEAFPCGSISSVT